jgi:outer membrane protein OmpA-like peptidoglycan-associated protein
MNKSTRILLALAGCALLGVSSAAARIERVNLEFSPYAGALVVDEQLGFTERVSPLVGARLGIALSPRIAFEAQGGWSRFELPTTVEPVQRDLGMVSGGFALDLTSHAHVRPFITIGGGYAEDMSTDAAGAIQDPFAQIGGGLKIVGSSGLGVRLEAWQLMLGTRSSGTNNVMQNTAIGARLVLPFARKHGDIDGDGVADNRDLCASTPNGATVDAKGCPTDGDSDGIWDGLDLCSATPAGASVDGSGCPADADRDGVFDGIDVCAATVAGAVVDARGCPTDGDKDGVVDGLDNCPDTPAGTRVDASGCKISQLEYEMLDTGKLRLQGVNFITGSAQLDPSSFAVLDETGEVLSRWPQLRIEVGGHTDSRGSNATNAKLSERRAQAVADYLLWKFPQISSSQLRVHGYGEELPVASNVDEQGRSRNRRVELTVLNREELRQIQDSQKQQQQQQQQEQQQPH